MGSDGELLRQVTVAARAVAGSDDGEERVFAASTLRVLLEQRRVVSRALLTEELGHADACPIILAACSNRDGVAFERFCDQLTRIRGADLVHVGVSRQLQDKRLVWKLREWARSDVAGLPRLVILDGTWAAQAEVNDTGADVISRLMEWLALDGQTLPRVAAVRRLWRETLSTPERARVWRGVVWDMWPEHLASDRDYVFEQADRLLGGDARTPATDPPPRAPLRQLVHSMTMLGLCAGPRPPGLGLAALDELAATMFPRMVAGQHGTTLGVMAARRHLPPADLDTVLDRYLELPSLAQLTRGASFAENAFNGFLTGLARDLVTPDDAGLAVPAHLLDLRPRLIELHARVDAAGTDAFGRQRGSLLATLVALDHPDLLIRRIEHADRAHPHELKLGCQALARRLHRGDTEIMIGVVESVLGALRNGDFPWSYRVLEALVDELPERRWGGLQHRIAVARSAGPYPGVLLSATVVHAILGDQDDDQIRRAVITGGQVPVPSLFTIRMAMRGSIDRGDVHLRQLEHVPLADRIDVAAQWTDEAAAGGARVTAGEMVQLLATLRRLHLAAFLSPDATLALTIHDVSLRAIEAATTAWAHLLQPYPRGQYAGSVLLALLAEVALLAPPVRTVVNRTRSICAATVAATWAALFGRGVDVGDDEAQTLRRAIIASQVLGIEPPAQLTRSGVDPFEVEIAAILAELDEMAGRDPSQFPTLNRKMLDRLETMPIPSNARVPYVVRLMLHNLKRRFEMEQRLDPAKTVGLVRRLRALLGGPLRHPGDFRDVVEDALDLAGARGARVAVDLEERDVPLPEAVCLLITEEMIANAVEHGAADGRITVQSPRHGYLLVTNEPAAGETAVAAVTTLLKARASGISGTRFAAEVASRWGLELVAAERDGRVCVSLDVRRSGWS